MGEGSGEMEVTIRLSINFKVLITKNLLKKNSSLLNHYKLPSPLSHSYLFISTDGSHHFYAQEFQDSHLQNKRFQIHSHKNPLQAAGQ